jgi:hypothetical protein
VLAFGRFHIYRREGLANILEEPERIYFQPTSAGRLTCGEIVYYTEAWRGTEKGDSGVLLIDDGSAEMPFKVGVQVGSEKGKAVWTPERCLSRIPGGGAPLRVGDRVVLDRDFFVDSEEAAKCELEPGEVATVSRLEHEGGPPRSVVAVLARVGAKQSVSLPVGCLTLAGSPRAYVPPHTPDIRIGSFVLVTHECEDEGYTAGMRGIVTSVDDDDDKRPFLVMVHTPPKAGRYHWFAAAAVRNALA